MDIAQVFIVIFSCSSVWLFANKNHHKWGFVAGLCGQPFWVYATISGEQWGMVLVSLWFTGNHIRGILNNFKVNK